MTDTFSTVALVFGIIFGGLFLLLGLVLVLVGGLTLWDWLRSVCWRQMSAQVESSELVEERHFEGDLFYKPKISYSYSLGADRYTGQRIAFTEKLFTREAAGRRFLLGYPVGMLVTCYVDPLDPTLAVLKRRGGVGGLLLGLLGAVMVAAPIFAGLQAGLPVAWIKLAAAVVTGLFCLGAVLNLRVRRRKQRAVASHLYPPPGRGSDDDVLRLLQQGERLLAIKLYRELHGTDLKSSRIAVDELGKGAED